MLSTFLPTDDMTQLTGGPVLSTGIVHKSELHSRAYDVPEDELLSWGKEIIFKESEAVRNAGERLDLSFASAVKMILDCPGKVVVTGLGKSGHVGAKIAATLASVGTPALFLHAAEALHGDLGMVTSNDIVLAIAFGGETREVLGVCKFARRTGLKVIGMTGKLGSSLAELTDVTLNASITGEADSLGLAPTSSTSVCLALGDALAVALMKARRFKEENFAQFHPGGRLGRNLILAEELMHKKDDLNVVSAEAGFHTVMEAVTSPNFGIVAVTNEEGIVQGSVSDEDIRGALLKHGGEALTMKAAELMNDCPKTVTPGVKAVEVGHMMEQFKMKSVLVTDEKDQLLGLLRLYDLQVAKIV